MKKFLVLYGSSVPASQQMASASPEQMKAGMDLWKNWARDAGSAIVDLGAPLGNAANVQAAAVRPSASPIAGFSILQADSRDAVTDLLKTHPHHRAPGASIEVFELLSMPGM